MKNIIKRYNLVFEHIGMTIMTLLSALTTISAFGLLVYFLTLTKIFNPNPDYSYMLGRYRLIYQEQWAFWAGLGLTISAIVLSALTHWLSDHLIQVGYGDFLVIFNFFSVFVFAAVYLFIIAFMSTLIDYNGQYNLSSQNPLLIAALATSLTLLISAIVIPIVHLNKF